MGSNVISPNPEQQKRRLIALQHELSSLDQAKDLWRINELNREIELVEATLRTREEQLERTLQLISGLDYLKSRMVKGEG